MLCKDLHNKGKVEKFRQKADRPIAEIRAAHVHSVEELDRRRKMFLEQEYQKEARAGIKGYYESCGASAPSCGITPGQERMRGTGGLVFMDVSVVAEAFLHRETRRTDEAGCFSFEGCKYEASAALANLQAEIVYGPMDAQAIMAHRRGTGPVAARRMGIGAFASKVPPAPVGMTGEIPGASRLLGALEKKYKEDHGQMARALSFEGCGKEAGSHV